MESYIAFDLETSGLSASTSEIIEIGAWKVEKGVVVQKFVTLVKQNGYLSREIQNITGITPLMLRDAPSMKVVMPAFIEFCGDYPFLAHNLQFDYRFLCAAAERMGLDVTLNGERTGVDTLDLSRGYCPDVPNHKLGTMAEHFGIHLEADDLQYHRAEYDAFVTKLLYDKFLENEEWREHVGMPYLLTTPKKDTKYGKAVNNGTLSFT